MSLSEFAIEELKRAGLFDKDSDYERMLGNAVMELVNVFAKQGHSGFSAMQTLRIFGRVANWKPLTPISSDPSEWQDVSDFCSKGIKVWQNRRESAYFSYDGGKHFYNIDERPIWKYRLRRWLCEKFYVQKPGSPSSGSGE